jgi:hypothetical protein
MEISIDNNNDHEIQISGDSSIKPTDTINFIKEPSKSNLLGSPKKYFSKPKPTLSTPDIGIELLMNNKKKLDSGRSSRASNYSNDLLSGGNNYSSDRYNSDGDFSDIRSVKSYGDNYDRNRQSYSRDGNRDEYNNYSDMDGDDNISISSRRSGRSGSFDDGDDRNGDFQDEEVLSFKQTQRKKRIYLYKLRKLKTKHGCQLSREYTMDDDLKDMIDEYRDASVGQRYEKSIIRNSRKMLINFVSGIEYLNKRFDPIGAKLDGWSEQTMDDIEDYDEVFEDLEEKYGESFEKISPELRLVSMVTGSAFMFHLTNSLFKNSMPGLDDILKQNPELMKNVQMAAMQNMSANPEVRNDPVMSSMLGGFTEMAANKPAKQKAPSIPMPPVNTGQLFRNPVDTSGGKSMKGPSGVDDILGDIYGSGGGDTKNVSLTTQQPISTTTKKKRGRPRKKINVIDIQ